MAKANNLIDINGKNDDVIELDLTSLRKKKIKIKIDDNPVNDKIIELNTSDLGVISRYKESMPKFNSLQSEVQKLLDVEDTTTEEGFSTMADVLKNIDSQMREMLDFIFQSNVSEICGSEGNMFDPVEGAFRWEVILYALIGLYGESIDKEIQKERNLTYKTVHKHTDKYVGK